MESKTAILVNVRDRPSEIALLLQSLRTQNYKYFDVFILDDMSGTPLTNYNFFNCLINRMKLEGNKVFLKRTEFPHGVSKARQAIVDWVKPMGYEYFCRVDDDVILEPDFLQRLIKVLEEGYDLASGVTAPMVHPQLKRDPKHINGFVNRVLLDKEGNFIMNGDDCGMEYNQTDLILPAHHFRSSALYKSKIHEKVNYTPTKLSKHGFREEQIFSFKLLMAGFKIGIDLNAMAWHQLTPSGGERFAESNELTQFNQKELERFTKENKDKLSKYFPKEPAMSELELTKENNLLMK